MIGLHVNIPMNKVTEMRQILINYKNHHSQNKIDYVQLSSKRHAEIKERLNKVEDIQKLLNDGIVGNSNHKAPSFATKVLNLPLNRVNEMKNWLIEF